MLSINLKYKKPFKKQLKNTKLWRSASAAVYGQFSLKTTENGILTEKQIEAARRVVSRITKRKCKLWILTPANKPITAKPNEVRMGKGKGNFNQYVRFIKTGEIVFELSYTNKRLAYDALISAKKKFPLKTVII